ncbi:tandem-95 repeat protein [uncultured Tateyamaria sp.]|uniref:tandem-95 repeat protein n=1 Tax=uncultured Tateyamaria sp. TaxID=455651 RepID=UPI002635F2EE|nr:tandem-95 repeat protein [uncultured Tateyamaria sp.]
MTVMNTAPVLAIALPNQSSAEDEAVSFALPANAFTDMDGDALTLSATLADGTALPGWLEFDAVAGSFSGTPPQDFHGMVNVMVTASDGSLSASSSFVLDVTPVNDAPVAVDDTVDPSEFLVNEFTDGTQNNPSVTALANGHFVVTWQSDDGQQGDTSETAIKAHILNENGVEIVSEFLVNEVANGNQRAPSVTALANGHFAVIWESHDGQQGDTDWAIKARIFDANGDEVVSEFLVNEFTNGDQVKSSVTALANGDFVITWTSHDGQQGDTDWAIKARIFDATGDEIVSEFLVNEITHDLQWFPSVTALANGNFVVTWRSDDGQQQWDYSSAIKARILNENGDEIVSEFLVNEASYGEQSWPRVTTLADGNFVVTWMSKDGQQGEEPNSYAIKARIFDANGDEIVSEFLVNEFTNDGQLWPSVTALTNGNFVVTWTTFDWPQGDMSGWAIKARIFDANGDEVVSEFLVNEITYGSQWASSVTALANGDFVVTWTSENGQQGDTDGYAVKARVFDANGVAQSHKIITEDVVTLIETATLLANDSDVDGDALTVASVSALSAHGATLTLNTDGTISYDPTGAADVQALAEGQTLTDTFTYTVEDGQGGESTASVSVVVHGTNDAPVLAIVLPDQSSAEDEAVSFALPANAFTDVDGDALTLSATLADGTALPGWLEFDAASGSFSGTPPQDFNGIVNVTVTASDGSLSASSAFALEITPVNDAPVAVNDVAQSSTPITEDVVTLIDTATLLANDSDVDGDALTMIAVNAKSTHGAALTLNSDGTISYDPTGAADVQALTVSQTLIDTFSYATDDGNGGLSVATVSIIVHGTNDAPVVAIVLPDQASAEDEAVSFVLPANAFTDVDGDALSLSATLVGGAALPDWLVFDAAAGSFSGTPPQDFHGTLSVQVTASDGSLSASDTFALEITPVNDAPVAADDVAQSSTPITEDVATPISTTTLLSNDSDVDGDALTVTSVSTTSTHGATLTLNTDGTISYDPTGADDVQALAEGQTLTDTFTYTVKDGDGSESTASVSVVVHGTNDAPVLAIVLPDQASAEDEAVSFVLPANAFTDVDGDALTLSATLVGGAALPDWLVFDAAAGSFSGTPPQDFHGTLSVQVTASDGSLSASDTFALEITPVNDAPVAADDIVGTSEFRVNEFTNDDQGEPSVTTDPGEPRVTALANGHFVVTWQSDDGQQGDTSHSAIKARILDADGAEIVGEFLVNEFTNDAQSDPSITALANDHFVVIWRSWDQQQGDDNSAIKARIFDADGNEGVTEFLVNEFTDGFQWSPSVTTLANGHFVVTWMSDDGQQGDTSHSAIKARIFDADGDEIVSEFQVNEFTNSSQSYPSVTALANGHFVVTWTSEDGQQGDTSGPAIKASILNENGVEIVGEFLVNEFTNGGQATSSVTALANGYFVVTWASEDGQQGDTSGSAIKARIFDTDGNEMVSEFLVNEFTNSIQGFPSVTALANGGFVVTWMSYDGHQGDASHSAIKARIFDTDGNETVSEFRVNEFIVGHQVKSSVTALANGDFVITWVSEDGQQGDTSGSAIQARIFDANGVAQGPNIITEDAVALIDTATLLANDSDVEGDALTVTSVSTTSTHGAALTLNTDGTISYDPTGADDAQALAVGRTLVDTFTYTVEDGNGGESTASVSLVVHGANDAPVVALALEDRSSAEDEAVSFALPDNAFTDVDGDELTLSATLTDGTALPDWLVFDAVTGSFSGTPSQDFHGTLSVTVTASDGSLSASGTFALEINAAPVLSVLSIPSDIQVSSFAPESHTFSNFVLIDGVPSVANLSDGGWVVTWAHGIHIYAQRYDVTGMAIGDEFWVSSDTSGYLGFPSITGLPDGGFVVSWHSFGPLTPGNTGPGVSLRRYDAAGAPGETQFIVGGQPGVFSTPSITLLADGGYAVSWGFSAYSQRGVLLKRYDAAGVDVYGDGVLFGVDLRTAGQEGYTQSIWEYGNPSIAALPSGGYVVAWESYEQDGDSSGISLRRYDASGETAGSEVQVNTTTAGRQVSPSVTALPNGDYVVVWVSFGQDGDVGNIYLQRYDAEGVAVGGEIEVNSYTMGRQVLPSIAGLLDGGFVVSWVSDGQDGDADGIFMQRYNAEGVAVGDETQVNIYSAGNQSHPSVTALLDGGFVVSWQSDGQDGDGPGVFQKVFNADGSERSYPVYVENAVAVAVAPGLVVMDVNSADLAGATITVTDYVAGQDVLSFVDQGGITGAWDAAAGTLTLTGVATLAAYETALRSVAYANTSDDPTGTARTIAFQVDDGSATDNNLSEPVTTQVTIIPINDAPVAADDVAQSPTPVTEDAVTLIDAATLLVNDSDVEGDALTVTSVSALSAHGATLTLNTDGTISYDPTGADAVQALAEGQTLTDTFTYTVDDGNGGESTATVSVVVLGRNEAPIVFVGTDFGDHIIGGSGNDELYGLLGNDLLIGGAGDDFLQGDVRGEARGWRLIPDGNGHYNGVPDPHSAPGQDILTGGAGADVFNFVRSFGHDTITDFEVGTDIIRFDANGESDIAFNDVSITEVNGNAVVSIPLHMWGSIILEGIGASQLTEDDFMFM